MKLVFLGTKAYIKERSRRHVRHSALALSYRKARLVIDCGLDWLGEVGKWRAAAILLTHAHPDHAFGLQGGAPCPVYATEAAWEAIGSFPIEDKRRIPPGRRLHLQGFEVTAFPVVHSLRAPAVGFRVAAGRRTIFYVPDVVEIEARSAALRDVDLYIGDGSSLTRPLVRQREGRLFGHTTIRAQLGWCAAEGVEAAVFTHCGSQFVKGNERRLKDRLTALAAKRGLSATLAYDGMEITLR